MKRSVLQTLGFRPLIWILALLLGAAAHNGHLDAKPAHAGPKPKDEPSDGGDSGGSDSGDDSSNDNSDNSNGNSGNSNGNSGGNSGSLIGDGATESSPRLVYFDSGWNVSGDYTVVGPTVIVIDGDFDIGNNTIDIAPTGSLELYVSGDITVNGKGGINNQGVPANLLAFGTQPMVDGSSSPVSNWTLSGNGALTGVVYAPSVEYRTNGGGNSGYTSGSVVALDIRFNGSPGPFHFDEALADLVLPFGGYSLESYDLLRNGSLNPSTDAKAVFGSTDYKSLFQQLYP